MEAKNQNIDDLDRIVDHNSSASGGLSSYSSIAILITATLFFAYHLISEYLFENNTLPNVLLEGSVLVLLLTVLIDEFIKIYHLNAIVSFNKNEASLLKKYFINTVNHQFENWELTESEIKVALLLIKGMSTSEIALMLRKKDFVIEQRALDIYRKANVKDRYELISYFFNDLFKD